MADPTVGVSIYNPAGAGSTYLRISFHSQSYAGAYLRVIKQSGFQKVIDSKPEHRAGERHVSLRLPSEISEIQARDGGGFNFVFTDGILKDNWVRNVKLWQRDDQGNVYIEQKLSQRSLARKLGLSYHPKQPRIPVHRRLH